MTDEHHDGSDTPLTEDATDSTAPRPVNREQRRAAQFRPNAGRPDPHSVGAEPVEDEVAAPGGDDQRSFTRSGSGDVTRLTGAGTGGATESGTRQPHHEGTHFGNQPNS